MIRAQHVAKYYGGKRALGPVSFEIQSGETIGFLGLNGAGKTTALRILACDLRPSEGSISVDGIDAISHPQEVRRHIGFLPEHPPVYGDMTVEDYLHFAGRLRGMSRQQVQARLPEVVEVTDLGDVTSDVIGTLSHGFRQRVGVAQAIIHAPKLVILDEPTRGLDPVQIVEMRNLIHDLKQAHTVLISSHILTEISQTCDRLLVLGAGQLLAAGSQNELIGAQNQVRGISVMLGRGTGDASANAGNLAVTMRQVLLATPGVTQVDSELAQGEAFSFALQTAHDCRAAVSRAVVAAGFDLLKLDHTRSELENMFIRMVGTDYVPTAPTAHVTPSAPVSPATTVTQQESSHGGN